MPGDEFFPSDAGGGRRPQRDDRPRQSSRGRVPPHNIEAEESVLGALLLSREAIGVVSEMGVNPSDFYKPAHRHIFDAIRSLYSSGAPADTVTVADELRRAGLLAEVGGAETLHELQNTTPSISSAGHYAKIVQETALLRQLIFAAGDIADLDELLSGLRPSALYIVGARPAMGKCVAFDTPVLDTATGEVVTALELMERAERADAATLPALGADG